jgi:DNA-binding response OmpR family regulator
MGKAKILIVDDDPDITEAVKVVLENQGYSVDSAKDGSEGMEHIKRGFNLVAIRGKFWYSH